MFRHKLRCLPAMITSLLVVLRLVTLCSYTIYEIPDTESNFSGVLLVCILHLPFVLWFFPFLECVSPKSLGYAVSPLIPLSIF